MLRRRNPLHSHLCDPLVHGFVSFFDLQRFLEKTEAHLHALVKVHVLHEEIGSLKVLSALLAIELLLFFVLNYMPVKVGRLVETLTTAWD